MKRLYVLLLLSACTPAPEPPPDTPQPTTGGFGGIETLERPEAEFEVLEACLDSSQKAMVGQPLAQARSIMPASTRYIGPGELFVQDYRPTRSNVDYDAAGRVTRVWCG